VDISGEPDFKTYSVSVQHLENETADTHAEPPVLKLTVPEMFNLALRADEATVHFRKKILGDVSLDCQSGFVQVDQLRGEHIRLHCNDGKMIEMRF
jgi:hypothetical protein